MYYPELIKLLLERKVFLSFIANFPSPVELVITQAHDHVKVILSSQLINGISRVLRKLLKYSNDTIISTSFVLPSAREFPVIFTLDWNDLESANLSLRSTF